ncbi:hypothetical protein HRR83_007630 [Exophiala dermatitidis]|nr:hypothetical protein HRR73_002966 [Exophiala dermatitidis]KAJ4539462.1 hypothetical protein HRR77_006346 [Exophiala dermatitidis]KAJ4562884.1 hypothetical protein HRR79_006480 [Exophiala dermatitidis]KAJ4565909.1 hypothetical protein HRR81_007576 [Exophiala dermatitidis]KAJ4591129.1 hypothetical protein HRR83_007630 [Exophiala dermatitidis]
MIQVAPTYKVPSLESGAVVICLIKPDPDLRQVASSHGIILPAWPDEQAIGLPAADWPTNKLNDMQNFAVIAKLRFVSRRNMRHWEWGYSGKQSSPVAYLRQALAGIGTDPDGPGWLLHLI